MPKSKFLLGAFAALEASLPWIMLIGLLFGAYAVFVFVPYAGFGFSSTGQINQIYVPTTSPTLAIGDNLLQVGSVEWTTFANDLRQSFFEGLQPGDLVPITVERAGQRQTIIWRMPGPTTREILERLFNQWPLSFMFWAAGAFTFLSVRPKNGRWWLLLAFYFITASWLNISGYLSLNHIAATAVLLRVLIWLSVPIYWHLHWVLFETEQKRLHFNKFWFLIYSVNIGLAVLAWFEMLPPSSHLVGIILAFGGSLAIVFIQSRRHPNQRREIGRLVFIWGCAALPPIITGVTYTFLPPNGLEGGAFLILPIVPIAYLYTAYRHHLGTNEVRANRLLVAYLFIILVSSLLAVLFSVAQLLLPNNYIFLDFVITLVFIVVAALGFPNFQQFVERWLLHVPWSYERITDTYLERIVTTPDTTQLTHLLQHELLPTLLIRQSALLRHVHGQLLTVYCQNIAVTQLPTGHDLPALLAQSGRYIAPLVERPYAWVRVVLPLKIADEVIGLWLLGRRDPDDFYAQTEVQALQNMAHQTAIALSNISNAERLRYLYQNTIDQDETARAYLGRELHDHTLQALFILRESVVNQIDPIPTAFEDKYQAVTQSLRGIIRGLRPPMLDYGLYHAFAALADEWENRPTAIRLCFEVPQSDVRYPQRVEEYIYRIVQQAGENAFKHAHATEVTLRGQLDADALQLSLLDDGQGFDIQAQLLLRHANGGHFGLLNMQERATLIGAQLRIDSVPNQGTQIHLHWRPTT